MQTDVLGNSRQQVCELGWLQSMLRVFSKLTSPRTPHASNCKPSTLRLRLPCALHGIHRSNPPMAMPYCSIPQASPVPYRGIYRIIS